MRLEFSPGKYITGIGGLIVGVAMVSFFVVFPISSWLKPAPETLKAIENDYGKTLDSQVKYLTGEITRVKKYEEDLKVQSELLDSVLEEIGGIDTNPAGEQTTSQQTTENLYNKSGLFDLGVGGRAEPLIPLRNTPDSVSKLFLGLDKSSSLVDKLNHQVGLLKGVPLGRPAGGRVTSDFGYRRSPFTGRRQMHHGTDFAGQRKSPVIATAHGVVKQAGYRAGYGKTVVIEHAKGFETLYGHLNNILVQVGDDICRGQEIGKIGSTGRSTGPHLHYEIRHDGQARNPTPFVEAVKFLDMFKVEDKV